MNLVKKIFSYILHILSRILFKIIPTEFRSKNQRNNYKIWSDEQKEKSYNHFKKYFNEALIWTNYQNVNRTFNPKVNEGSIREFAIKAALKNDTESNLTYLEFGVYKARTINFFSKFVKKIYGFDGFEGLKDVWKGTSTGVTGKFDLKKKIPEVNENVELIIGWVQDTLESFLKKNNPKINFVHMDLDTYESSKFVLEKIKPFLTKNAIILFDELYNYPGWEVGEYKALKETFKEDEYKFLAFESIGGQVVIQLKN